MTFDNPSLLLLLLALIPYAAVALRVLWKICSLGSAMPSGEKGGAYSDASRRSAAFACGAAFYACAVFALANPSLGTRYVSEQVRDVETVFVLDVSNSMASVDGGESRLLTARAFVRAVVAATPGTRNALYAFKGSTVLIVPPTSSALAFDDGLAWADPSVVTSSGSDVGLALSAANRRGGAGLARVVVLLTDGNDTGSNAAEACKALVKSGVRLCIVGFGSAQPLAVLSPSGKEILDLRGNPVYLAGGRSAMRGWADSSGASYVHASDALSLSYAIDFVMKNSMFLGRSRSTAVPASLQYYFMLAAAVFFAAACAASMPLAQRSPKKKSRAVRAVGALLMASSFFSCGRLASDLDLLKANSLYSDSRYNEAIALYLSASGGEDEDALSLNVANAFVALGEFDSALPLYEKITSAGSDRLASAAWYNMGLAWYKRELYDEALVAFRKSLLLRHSAPDASKAYELALAAKRQHDIDSARERSRAMDGPGSESAMFSLSRKAHTELFVPGTSAERSMRNDH